MAKLDKRFNMKCDQMFLDQLDAAAKRYKESHSWVVRALVQTLHEEET